MPQADTQACETSTLNSTHRTYPTQTQQGVAGYPTEHSPLLHLQPSSPHRPSRHPAAPEAPAHIPEGAYQPLITRTECGDSPLPAPTWTSSAVAVLVAQPGAFPLLPGWLLHTSWGTCSHTSVPEVQLCACTQSCTGFPHAPDQPGTSINASQGLVFPDSIWGADRKRGLKNEGYFTTHFSVCSPCVFLTCFISNHPQSSWVKEALSAPFLQMGK